MRSTLQLDAAELSMTALFDVSVEYIPRDRETGEPGRHYATARFRGLLIGRLFVPADDARKAMSADPAGADAWVKRLEAMAEEEAASEADLARAA